MSKKKLTEKVLLEGMTPYNTHSNLLAKTEQSLIGYLSLTRLNGLQMISWLTEMRFP